MLTPKQAHDIAWNKIGNKIIILELREERLFHELNEAASFLWKQIIADVSFDNIALGLASRFNIPLDEAKHDTQTFLNELQRLKLTQE